MTTSGTPAQKTSQNILLVALVAALILLLIYTYIDLAGYMDAPWLKTLPDPWNDNAVYLIIIAAALSASCLGFTLTRQFKASEPQRPIWLFFASGWTCWLLGEVSGYIYRQLYPTLPYLTITDAFWAAGYIFLGLSLFYQYVAIYLRGNIYASLKRSHLWIFYLYAGLVLLVALVVTVLIRQAGFARDMVWMATYLLIFYPLCDLGEGLAAMWFSFLFRRGPLSLPWLGLLAFAVSDGISSWYWMGGSGLLSPQMDIWISLCTDVLYICGYLVAALGCLSVILTLKSEPASHKASPPARYSIGS